jgi:Holliday junction DNA helicase RuvA
MIAALRGQVISRSPNRVIVDVQGVGYDVACSAATVESLPENGEVFFHVYTALRENALELYGFIERDEKTLFELLLGVTGIGPRLALTILSGISPGKFQDAVLVGDHSRLTAIPGIGKKSAERIVLELKDKIERLGLKRSSPQAAGIGLEEDLVSSLVNLGYKDRVARDAAAKALAGRPLGLTLPEAVKSALKELKK